MNPAVQLYWLFRTLADVVHLMFHALCGVLPLPPGEAAGTADSRVRPFHKALIVSRALSFNLTGPAAA